MVHVLVIAVFGAIFVHDELDGVALTPGLDPAWGAAGMLGTLVLLWLAMWRAVRACERGLDRRGNVRYAVRAERLALAFELCGSLVVIAGMLGLGWLEFVRAGVGDLVMVDEAVAVAPAVGVFVGAAWAAYPIERRLREAVLIRDLESGRPVRPVPSRRRHVMTTLRNRVSLMLVPLLLITGASEGVTVALAGAGLADVAWVGATGQLAVVLGLFALMPAVMRRVWRTAPLADGALRRRLSAVASAHGVRVRDLLVWETDGLAANGAALGLVPLFRYVLLTDVLLEELPVGELEAVTAHEVGHIYHRHALGLVLAVVGTVGLVSAAAGWLLDVAAGAAGLGDALAPLVRDGVVLAVAVAATLAVVAFVSQLFERQADAFAIKHLSGHRRGRPVPITSEAASTLASGLVRVSAISGMAVDRATWRHGSVSGRRRAMLAAVGRMSDTLEPDRTAARVRVATLALFVLGLLAIAGELTVGGREPAFVDAADGNPRGPRLESRMGLSGVEQRVAALIAERHQALVDDLRLHVALPTGGYNKEALDETRERLASRLTRLGSDFELIDGAGKPAWLLGGDFSGHVPPTAVCRRTGAATAGRVLIAGHLDTVHEPDGPFRELSIAPDGATATGPGCVDMKGGLVIAVAALEALEEAGVPASWSFLMNSDEETGTYHSEAALRGEAARHDFGIALEPALPGGELAIERVGSGQFMIECRGRSAHVGRAFVEGVSAVNALAERVLRVREMSEPETGRIVSIGPLRGGHATNAVPDFAAAWGNVRFADRQTADELGTMLDGLQTTPDAMPAVAVHRSFNRPAKPRTPRTERLALAARAVAEDLGQALPFASTGGVCDGNILQDAGLATIDTLGVRGGGLHTPDEWIELSSLVERCQLLAVLIARLSAGGVETCNEEEES